ncbi:helix-turn-helix domain-containing protein [Brevibacterium luteolum]|uniref:PucR family transcriptional regulator n=1 Tax=Brevibacterium luteolum TaxID=199591 RepID=A0A6G8KW63_9MICO|nr:helix-turn-helix domain-containing protein [Brevibacterium luteolum]QIN28896.1 PucR family transcriptional regulator [Brevibacterium luteolum]
MGADSTQTAAQRRPITASMLLAEKALALTVVVPGPGLDAPLTGSHTTELTHPSRYLFAGELLLTNGLWMTSRSADEWIAEAHAAGAEVVGFGLSDESSAVPGSVVDACRTRGLALLAVAADVSFSRIAEAIDVRRAPTGSARAGLDHIRRLGGAIAGCTDHEDFLRLIERLTGLECWLVGTGGRCLAGSTAAPPADLRRTAVRLGRSGHLSGSLNGQRCFFTVAWGLQSNVALVVAAAQSDIADEARLVIESIMPYFLIVDAERRSRAGVHETLARELLDLIWSGSITQESFEAQLRTLGLDPDRHTMIIASANTRDDVADAVSGCAAAGVFTAFDDVQLMIVQPEGEQIVDEIASVISESGADPILGIGASGIGPEGLRRSLAHAIPACRVAVTRPQGARVIREYEASSYAGLLHFVDVRMRSAFRQALLGPIIAWDAEHDSELLETLRVFLVNDGRWRQAARELHIHHNTLKYRIERIAALTGRDLSAPDSRVDLVLALAIPDSGSQQPRGS